MQIMNIKRWMLGNQHNKRGGKAADYMTSRSQ